MQSALLAAAAASAAAGSGCRTDDDCQLNGVCNGGSCRCDPGWMGGNCSVLDLRPASPIGAYGWSPNVSSWGGNAVEYEGQYHLFAAEMFNHCGLAHWGTNSQIMHAVSGSPAGPYKRVETVVGSFAHNPEVVYTPGGGNATFVLFHITHHDPVDIPDCTTDPTGHSGTKPNGGTANGGNIRAAPTPAGPWETANGGCNNAGPYRHPNGTWYQLCRDGGGGEQYNASLMSAPSWRGPWAKAAHVAGPDWPSDKGLRRNCEDHYLWQDKRGNWKGLHHCFFGGGMSGFSYSRDGVNWRTSYQQPYNFTVAYTDGTVRNLTTRERPKLLLDADLNPAGLFNGARVDHGTGMGGKGTAGTDWTFTHFQPIGGA